MQNICKIRAHAKHMPKICNSVNSCLVALRLVYMLHIYTKYALGTLLMGPTGLSPAVRIIMIDSESRVIIITGINPSRCHGESSVMSSSHESVTVSGPAPEARARRKLGNLNRSTSSRECPVIRTIRLLPAAASVVTVPGRAPAAGGRSIS